MISSYVVKNGFDASTHTGLKSIFNQELVKTGKISKEEGKLFNKLFGMRQEADCEDFNEINENDLNPLISKVDELIQHLEKLIED